MVVSFLRLIFKKQAEKHDLSAKDAGISDAIWLIGALLYFFYMD